MKNKLFSFLVLAIMLFVGVSFAGCEGGKLGIDTAVFSSGIADFYQNVLTNSNNGFTQNVNSMTNYDIDVNKQAKVREYYRNTILEQIKKYYTFFAVVNYFDNNSATEYGFDLYGNNIDLFIQEGNANTVSGKQYKTCILKNSADQSEIITIYIRKNGSQYEMLLEKDTTPTSYATYVMQYNMNNAYAILTSTQSSKKTTLELCKDKNDKIYMRYAIQDLLNIEFLINTKTIGIKHNISLSNNNSNKVVYDAMNSVNFRAVKFAEKTNNDNYLELNINYSGSILAEDFGVFEQTFVANNALEAKYVALLESDLIW